MSQIKLKGILGGISLWFILFKTCMSDESMGLLGKPFGLKSCQWTGATFFCSSLDPSKAFDVWPVWFMPNLVLTTWVFFRWTEMVIEVDRRPKWSWGWTEMDMWLDQKGCIDLGYRRRKLYWLGALTRPSTIFSVSLPSHCAADKLIESCIRLLRPILQLVKRLIRASCKNCFFLPPFPTAKLINTSTSANHNAVGNDHRICDHSPNAHSNP
jgi:hypothetical protein